MSFAWPAGLLFALLALPILVLYVLKVRLRRLPVSTNLFWRQVYNEKPPRSIWQQLRHLLSLFAQLLILCLLVWAMADPYLPWQILQARRIVLVVDNSASMQAADIAPSRLAAAKDEAQKIVSGLREHDQVAIVLAGKTPEVLVGMTGHIPTLRRSVEAIPLSDNATYLQAAVRLGQQLIADHPHGEVIVLTDGCISSDDQAQAAPAQTPAQVATERAAPVTWKTVATEANNLGIIQFQTRRSLTDSLGYEILIAISNASQAAARCRLEVTLNDIPVDVIPLDLKPEEKWQQSLEKTSIEGGILRATLTEIQDSSDSQRLNELAADDTAWAVLPARARQKVLVVSPGNLFLRKVFEANPLVDLEVREAFPESWPADAVIVLHRNLPDVLPAGNVFVVDPENDCDVWTVGDALDHPIITEQDENSPLMTHIRLDNILVPEAKKLQFTAPPTVLAGTVSGDVIYAQPKRDFGRCLVLSVNLEQSDLAFRTAFPIMVTNALNWFARQSGELRPSLSTGSLLAIDLSESMLEPSTELQLVSPSGTTQNVAASEPKVTLGAFGETGVWRLQRTTKNSDGDSLLVRAIAVNLANQRESDLRPEVQLAQQALDSESRFGWLNRPIWFYLTLLACLLITAEWFLYQRRMLA